LTTGPNFALVGGTQDTHDAMTEKAIKINEKLAAKGKQLEDISRDEFDEIAHSVGLQRRVERSEKDGKSEKDEKKNENE
jgi:seryl-tRNA(Sec) selenium transferase